MSQTNKIEAKNGSSPNHNSIFQQLVYSASHTRYPLYSGKNVMELPLYFTLGKSFIDNLSNFYSQYLVLLKDNEVDDSTIEIVEELTEKLKKTVNNYLNGKVGSAYSEISDVIKLIKTSLPIKIINNGIFYRMRAEGGLLDSKDFYHLPFNKVHLSKSERFSIEGYPCLYLGYSKRVCELEISSGSLAEFKIKEPLNNIIDLTFGQGDGKEDISEIQLVTVFPLIASCYIVPFYSTIHGKECRPDKSFFREEYIIPQLLTQYLREEDLANGIIYYSVKDPNLDTHGKGENDLRNLVLFTNRANAIDNIYDNVLMDKFQIKL